MQIRDKDVDAKTVCPGRLDVIGVAVKDPLTIGMRCVVDRKEFLFRYEGPDPTAEP